jgi:hypothetical protein
MRVRHRRTRVPFCFGRHDSGVEDGTRTNTTKHVRGRMSRDDTTRPTRKRAVSELYNLKYQIHEVLSVPLTPSPPFPRRFRASISPLRPRG